MCICFLTFTQSYRLVMCICFLTLTQSYRLFPKLLNVEVICGFFSFEYIRIGIKMYR